MEKKVLENYEKAGDIAKKIKSLAAKEVKDGVKVLALAERIESEIRKEAETAFPVNISINDVAAHYTPDINDALMIKTGDLVKVDIGVYVDGYIADTAFSVRVGEGDDILIKASRDALEAFLKEAGIGKTIGELSGLIEDVVTSHGVKPIRNLAGHSLEQYIQHAGISIPNARINSSHELREDDVIAMEVFTTNGEGMVVESSPTLIYVFVRPGPIRMRESRLILERIEKTYKTLPFARRWLKDIASGFSLQMALKELASRGIIREYPPLRERARGDVAQTEETIVVLDKPVVTTR